MNYRVLFTTVIFLFAGSLLVGEDKALVLESVVLGDEAGKSRTIEQIREKFEDELRRQNLDYLSEAEAAAEISGTGFSSDQYASQEVAVAIGQAVGVPIVIVISIEEREGLMEVLITAWDTATGEEISRDRKLSKSEVTRYIMIENSISKVVSQLTGEYGVEVAQPDPKVRKITFLSNQEGMEIYLADGEFLGSITQAVLNITDREYEIGTKLHIVKKLKDHRSGEEFIYLDKERNTISLLDLNKATTLAWELNWTYLQLLGAGSGLRYYPVPDWFYLSFESYFYVQKDFTTSIGNEITHSDMRLLAGMYLGFGPESPFRISVSLGAGVVTSYPLDRDEFYVDTYLNLVNLSFELNLSKVSFYLRPELRYNLGLSDSTFNDSGFLLSEYYLPQVTVGVMRKW